MGYETDRFVLPVDDEYLCSICLSVFEDPVNGPCGHTFCSKCIENWIPLNVNTCPLDKKPLFRKDLTSTCLPFRNLLNRLDMKCDFESSGCEYICQLSRIHEHVKTCDHNPDGEMSCEQGCGLKFQRKNCDSHKCIDALKSVIEVQRVEIAELKRKAPKRGFDGSLRLADLSERRVYDSYQETMRRRLRDYRERQFIDHHMRTDLTARPSTSNTDSPPVLQRQSPTPNSEDLRSVRVMLRRLTDEQIQSSSSRREPPASLRFRAINVPDPESELPSAW